MIRVFSIIVLVFLFYYPAMNGEFIWDDDSYVTQNPLLSASDGLWRIWTTSESPQYYPIVFTSFWVEHKLWGLNPMGYHIVNILLHSANALMVWLLLRKIKVRGAWLIGAVFALHPVHVESVAWITERKNVLSGLFYLLSLGSYMRFEENNRKPYYFSSLILFLMALLSKTVTCSLPVAILILKWFKTSKISWKDIYRLIPFLIIGAAMGLLTVKLEMHRVGAQGADWDMSILQRILLAGNVIWFYVAKLVWPVNLTFIYPRWELDISNIFLWLRFFLVVATGFGFWHYQNRSGRGPVAGMAFFIVTLFPALGFFNVYPMRYSFVADHFQYLASLGVIALVIGGITGRIDRWKIINSMKNRGANNFILAGFGFTVLLVLGILTYRQGYTYQNMESLWRNTIIRNPGAWMAHNNLGVELEKQGKSDEAASYFKKGIKINPYHIEAYNNLANILDSKGKTIEAKELYEKAISISPNQAELHYNLGILLMAEKNYLAAINHFQKVVHLKPDLKEARQNLLTAMKKYKDSRR